MMTKSVAAELTKYVLGFTYNQIMANYYCLN